MPYNKEAQRKYYIKNKERYHAYKRLWRCKQKYPIETEEEMKLFRKHQSLYLKLGLLDPELALRFLHYMPIKPQLAV